MKRILLLLMMFVFSTPLFSSTSVWKESARAYAPNYKNSLNYYSFVDYFDVVRTTTINKAAAMLLAAPLNDDCAGAIDLPVNPAFDCVRNVLGTFKDATNSTNIVQPNCNPGPKRDVWYKFVATSKLHQLEINVPGVANWTINVAIYDKADCSLIKAAAFSCFNLTNAIKKSTMSNLVIGRMYYVRLGNTTANDYPFDLCLTSIPPPMRISPSGEQYTVEELVTNVLVKSGCNLVSNVTYKVGNGSPATKSVNTLGYFNKNGSIFPFDEGIVLGTSEVQYIPGPYGGTTGTNNNRWAGDKDLIDAINDTGGMPQTPMVATDMRVTQLEFDFVPVKDTIKFEYLFASNSYVSGCTYECGNGALFAAWLIDTTTGIGENLAKLPGTNTPIALNTIRDTGKSGAGCVSVNPQYYWNQYTNNQSNPAGAPFNFSGSTIPLSSRTVKVIPGRKYHIKLAVMDFCGSSSHTSAVFFNARSFDIGTPDLGEDLVIEGGNAICPGGSLVLGGDLDAKDYTIQWTKNGVD
ncbi:choice-of-anchor L domain-containing protein, partial [Flavobacterium sp. HSC-61S13]|uniref:choice-of-anchor L domain-containing protein n=1 Tax=Flavobacterium sp. HSC-61S13 TaxID=2910963 RepID=UPI00209DD10D